MDYFTQNDPKATIEDLTQSQAERILVELRNRDAHSAGTNEDPEEGGNTQEPPPEAPQDEYFPQRQAATQQETDNG